MIRIGSCFLVIVAVLIPMYVNSQDKGEPVSVHVKEVQRTKDQEAEKGFWLHTTAIVETYAGGKTKAIIYSLKCDAYTNLVNGNVPLCFPLSAGKDYSVHKFSTSMNFWRPEDSNKGQTLVLYEIVSEKEK